MYKNPISAGLLAALVASAVPGSQAQGAGLGGTEVPTYSGPAYGQPAPRPATGYQVPGYSGPAYGQRPPPTGAATRNQVPGYSGPAYGRSTAGPQGGYQPPGYSGPAYGGAPAAPQHQGFGAPAGDSQRGSAGASRGGARQGAGPQGTYGADYSADDGAKTAPRYRGPGTSQYPQSGGTGGYVPGYRGTPYGGAGGR
jgi:hypothetical protein